MDLHVRKSNRITRRLIIAVVLISLVFTLVFSAYQLYQNFNQAISLAETRLGLVESVHMELLAQSVWEADNKKLSSLLQGIMKIPDIQFLQVFKAGKLIVSKGQPGVSKKLLRTFPLVHHYGGKRITLAYLRAELGLGSVYQHLYDQVWSILLGNAVKTFFVAAVILFLFHALVTKHLQKITEYVRQVTVPDINEHRGLSKPGHGVGQLDEADTVVQAFENIRADISDAIDIVQEREAFIRLILDSTAEAIYGLDKSGRCLFVNKSCLKMLGYENETELLDKKIHAIIHRTYPNGDPYPEHECQIYKTISQGIATHVDDEFLWRKDGSGFSAEYWSHPTFEKDEISGAVVTFLDRSRRRNFLAEQGRLVSVIENASDFMGVVDLSGTFVFLNYAGRQLLRLGSSISLREMTLTQIIRECHTENYWGELMSQINKVGNWSGECHLLTQVDQKVIPVIMDVVYIDDKVNVTPTQMAVVIRDMTEIITVQEELKKHRDNLEETVEERTVELKNMLHELETFSYSVSHDLRAPLRGIDGFSLALLEDYGDKLDATGLGYLNKVRSAAQRMASLIDDLLQLSRVTRIEMKKSQLNLSELVENISHSMSEKYADRQIEVKVQQDIIVEGDSGLLKIAVENLLDNAWKYTAKVDAPMISFSVTEIEDRPVYVVQDNGVGFDMRYLHKIFGPFQRLHKVDDFEGSGIGLATVQRVIRRHNGEIWAKSVLSQGATFYFSLGP